MKIKSMTATFGRLDRARLDLDGGLNLIHAPNEGGKSTWTAFWLAMLYGIETRDRDRKGHLADKNRYQPWSGAPMEGEVQLEWQGRAITIRRSQRGSTPFGAFSATYTATGEPVPGLTAQNCGEVLTGAGREVFERSAILGGGNLTVTAAPQLEQRIAALISSGQEDVSLSQAEGRLREWANRRKVNRSTGLIPRLEGALAQVEDTLAQLSQLSAQMARLEGEQARLGREAEVYAAQARLHRQRSAQALNARFAQADRELDQARQQMARLEQESRRFGAIPDRELLKRAQGKLQYLKVLDEELQAARAALDQAEGQYTQARTAAEGDSRFGGMTPEEAAAAVQKTLDTGASDLSTARARRSTVKLFAILGTLSAVGLAVYGLVSDNLSRGLYLGGLAALFCALVCLLNHTQARDWQARINKALSRWDVDSFEALENRLEDYRQRCRQVREAAAQMKLIRGDFSDKEARRANDTADLMDFVHTFAPEVTALFGCSAALSRALNLDHDLSMARERVELCRRHREDLGAQGASWAEAEEVSLPQPSCSSQDCAARLEALQQELDQIRGQLDRARGAQSSLGDPAALSARREALLEELARRRQEQEAVNLAMEVLEQADSQLRERFSPALNRLAGSYLSQLTGQRYTALTLDRTMEGSATRQGDVLPHSALYLSRGTADQLYLAVRLAVCALCLPQKPPIVLDDALAAFDDGRMAMALDLLQKLAQDQQVLLFTCQVREGAALDGAAGVRRLELP